MRILISRRLLPAYISSPFIRRVGALTYKKAAKKRASSAGTRARAARFLSLSLFFGAKSGSLAVGITHSRGD